MTVDVGPLRFVRDHIVAHHVHSYVTEEPHQLELIFECGLRRGNEVSMADVPDAQLLGVAWLDAAATQHRTIENSWLIDVVCAGRSGGLAIDQGDRD